MSLFVYTKTYSAPPGEWILIKEKDLFMKARKRLIILRLNIFFLHVCLFAVMGFFQYVAKGGLTAL